MGKTIEKVKGRGGIEIELQAQLSKRGRKNERKKKGERERKGEKRRDERTKQKKKEKEKRKKREEVEKKRTLGKENRGMEGGGKGADSPNSSRSFQAGRKQSIETRKEREKMDSQAQRVDNTQWLTLGKDGTRGTIKGDGHCLYGSIRKQHIRIEKRKNTYQIEKSIGSYRTMVCNRKGREILEKFRQQGQITREIKEKTIKKAREGIGKNAVGQSAWGDPNSAIVISEILKIKLVVYILSAQNVRNYKKIVEYTPEQEIYPGEEIGIIYVGNHYEELNKKGKNEESNQKKKEKERKKEKEEKEEKEKEKEKKEKKKKEDGKERERENEGKRGKKEEKKEEEEKKRERENEGKGEKKKKEKKEEGEKKKKKKGEKKRKRGGGKKKKKKKRRRREREREEESKR